MKDFATIFRSEIVRRFRSTPFRMGMFIGVLAIGILTLVPTIMARSPKPLQTRPIVLIAQPAIAAVAAAMLTGDFDVHTVLADWPSGDSGDTLERLGDAEAYVRVDAADRGIRVQVRAREPQSFPRAMLTRDLLPLHLARATNVPTERLAAVGRIPLAVTSLKNTEGSEKTAVATRQIAYAFLMVLYFAVVFNSQAVLSAVAEEKTSRIAELLMSTIEPTALLAAKILATGIAALVQLTLWIATAIVCSPTSIAFFTGAHAQASASPSGMDPARYLALTLFFILGFLQYSAIYAAAGSLISRTEDIGSLSAPLAMPVILAFITAIAAITFPHAPPIVLASLVPLFAPFVMFARLAVIDVPMWQWALSLTINITTLFAITWGAGKVYRVGLLLYGKPPSFGQIIATLRA